MLSNDLIRSTLGLGTGDDDYLTSLEAGTVSDAQLAGGIWLGTAKAFVEVHDLYSPKQRLSVEAWRPQQIRLRQYVPSIAALTISERSGPDDAWEEVDQTDDDGNAVFELRNHRTLVRNIGAWPEGRSVIKVAFTVGYLVDSAPAPWRSIVLDLIAWRYKSPAARALGGNVEQAGVRGALVVFNTDADRPSMPTEIRARLMGLYRNPPDEDWVGVSYPPTSITQAAHGFAAKDWIGFDGTSWVKVAALEASPRCDGIVSSVIDANAFYFLPSGLLTLTGHGYTAGPLYLSQVTAGAVTSTAPTSGVSQQVAIVYDANRLVVQQLDRIVL